MIFVAGMSFESNRYLPAFMLAFSILALLSALMVCFLKESPMIITEQDRVAKLHRS
jgi:hypothetical protein